MIKRGRIVLTPFPFTDLSGQKVRPALVISKNLGGDDAIVVFISSKPEKKYSKYNVSISMSKENGLKTRSLINCVKIASLDKKIFLGELGELSQTDQQMVDEKLKQIIF